MNVWVLAYIIFAPVFGGVMFLWFHREFIKVRWWLYRHPESVFKCVFFYPNRMFEEKFVSTTRDYFEFDKGTYHIKREAIIRKNWNGWVPKTKVYINEENSLHYEHYQIYFKERFIDVPSKVNLIGELHYFYNVPEPIDYSDKDSKIVLYRTGDEENKVEKNSVLEQILTAEFKKVAIAIIIVLLVIVMVGVFMLVGIRYEWIKVPLHAVCVNVGSAVAGG